MGRKRSYKVCLTCGAELPYNLDQMRLETPQEARQRRKEVLA
jgi:ribosomal protein L40E